MTDGSVRPNSLRLTDDDARQLLSVGILRACAKTTPQGAPYGPTRVGLEIGCDEKTVRNARDLKSTMGLSCAFNLLDVDDGALDAIAASKGFVLSRMAGGGDVVAASGAALYKIGVARSPNSPGGSVETDNELIDMEEEVRMLEDATASLRARISAAKLRRAA